MMADPPPGPGIDPLDAMFQPLERHPHPAGDSDDLLLRQCDVRRGRATGPGGTHRNKVETAVELTHRPTGLTGAASERRSQLENQKQAIRRLRLNLAIEHRVGVDRSRAPTAMWRRRRQGQRIVCNPRHREYPALLAEALDTLAETRLDQRAAARLLGVSATQVLRLIAAEPRALASLNDKRTRRGLRPLKPR